MWATIALLSVLTIQLGVVTQQHSADIAGDVILAPVIAWVITQIVTIGRGRRARWKAFLVIILTWKFLQFAAVVGVANSSI